MFQTLVDVSSQKENILRAVFEDTYEPDAGNKFWSDADKYVYAYFHRMSTGCEPYKKTIDIFTHCYETLFPVYHLNMAPEKGAQILAEAHTKAALYTETKAVTAALNKKCRTCIISDTDNIMIARLPDKVGIDTVYTSEDYQAYKFDKTGRLFRAAVRDFNIAPEEMLHVGDGENDVLGAAAIGADTVWVNRNHKTWNNSVKPTYEVENLNQLLE